jgi:3-oxoacyl-[acyl-carrier protein] reductase
MTPQQVAQALVAGLEKNSPEIVVGWQSHLAIWCQRFAPWLLEQILNIAMPPQSSRQQPQQNLIRSLLTKFHRFGDLLWSRNMLTFVSARKS